MPRSPAHNYGLALAEARRALDGQLAVVDASRGRVSGLLGVGGLVGTFAGGLGATGGAAGMTPALWVAGAAFGVAVVVGLLVLFPWKFASANKVSALIAWGDEAQPRDAQEKSLAASIGEQVADNACRAAAIQWGLLVVAVAVAAEFFALAYQLVSGSR